LPIINLAYTGSQVHEVHFKTSPQPLFEFAEMKYISKPHPQPLFEFAEMKYISKPHPQPLSLIRRGEIKLILYRGEVIAAPHSY
jgi:hypothetical protein